MPAFCCLSHSGESFIPTSATRKHTKTAHLYYPPTNRRRGKYQVPPECTVQAKNKGMISGWRVSPFPLHNRSK